MSFWWEEGYSAEAAKEAAAKKKNLQKSVAYDGKGASFRLHELSRTGTHHLQGTFFHQTSSKFMMLNNEGRQMFTAALFEIQSTGGGYEFVEKKKFDAAKNSGFLSISQDDTIMTIGVLKQDSISVVELATEDLLIEMSGHRKIGYWGKTTFPEQQVEGCNNIFIELRVLKMHKSNPLESVLRMWDLGFNPPVVDGAGEDEEEDEEEKILWDYMLTGKCHYCVCDDFIIVTSEENQTIEWIDRKNGQMTNSINAGEWVSQPVLSASKKLFAVAHNGRCTIRCCITGDVIASITSAEEGDIYPVVPIGFCENDSMLALRIDLSMTFMLSAWNSAASIVAISDFGQTLSSESMLISPDERFIACWPYGLLELYDLQAVKDCLARKIAKLNARHVFRWSQLVSSKRATLIEGLLVGKLIQKVIEVDDSLLRIILTFVSPGCVSI